MRLKDVCEGITDGSHNPPQGGEVSEYLMISSKNIYDGMITLDNPRYLTRDQFVIEDKRTRIEPGDVLMTIVGTVGRTAVVNTNIGNLCLQRSVAVLHPRKDICNSSYLMYALRAKRSFFEKEAHGVAQKGLYLKQLSDVDVGIPDMADQESIVNMLDNVEGIIEKRQCELDSLDRLIKARFVEMFGEFDLSKCKSDWIPIYSIGKVVGGSTPKTGTSEFWNGEYRWISPAELQQDSGVIYDSIKKITKAGVESCSLQELPIGTVILSSRAPIGKVAIAGNTFYCNQGFKNIICSEDVLPRYLYTLLLYNTEYLNSLGRGATFKEISKSIVEQIKIPVPPLDLQNQFAIFVQQVDKSKVAVQKALDETQLLFDSLMQEYFG